MSTGRKSTGPQAARRSWWSADKRKIKRLCVELEDQDPLGRLFDMDVLSPDGTKLDREEFGRPPRPCLVCGKPGKGCASRRLRRAGLEAERTMFAATKGINTHKGAIFSLGTVCAAAGRLWKPEAPWPPAEAILAECAAESSEAVEADLASIQAQTAETKGQRFFLEYGLRGIRGELADGLPSVLDIGLPALEAALEAGATLEEAGAAALVRLVAQVGDTNLIARGGRSGQRWAAQAAASIAETVPDEEALKALDRDFIQRNLSPGGCADLLAITYFVYFCKGNRSNNDVD